MPWCDQRARCRCGPTDPPQRTHLERGLPRGQRTKRDPARAPAAGAGSLGQWATYHVRSRVAARMNCLKLFGERIISPGPDRQTAEIQLRILRRFSRTMYGWPLGKSFVRVWHPGWSRPCIRRLMCSGFAAARPDEVSRRAGPDQWHALRSALVRTGCPAPRSTVPVPSPHAAPHHLRACRFATGLAVVCRLKPRWPGSCRPARSVPGSYGPCGWPVRWRPPLRAFERASGRASPALGPTAPLDVLAAR